MKKEPKMQVVLVDDDPFFLKLLEIEFMDYTNCKVDTYSSGELCLEHINADTDVVFLDYHMDSIKKDAMNGQETLIKLKALWPNIRVVILSSQDKIEVAINCIHFGASDYVVKSETSFVRIKNVITTMLAYQKLEKQLNWYMDKM